MCRVRVKGRRRVHGESLGGLFLLEGLVVPKVSHDMIPSAVVSLECLEQQLTSVISSMGTTMCPMGFKLPKAAESRSNCISNEAVYGLRDFNDRKMPMSMFSESNWPWSAGWSGSGSDRTWTSTRADR
jgi:hypothetical protein